MTKKKRGILVKTADGQKGVYYQDDKMINGKYPVTMLKDNLQPKKNPETGSEVKRLLPSGDLKPIGFLN